MFTREDLRKTMVYREGMAEGIVQARTERFNDIEAMRARHIQQVEEQRARHMQEIDEMRFRHEREVIGMQILHEWEIEEAPVWRLRAVSRIAELDLPPKMIADILELNLDVVLAELAKIRPEPSPALVVPNYE